MVFDWMKTLFRQADETINEAVTIVEQTGWAVGASDQGKVRSNNEDAWFISLERQWFMVADGMGGHAAGEQASRIAIETVSAALNAVQVSAVADDRIVSLLTRVCQLTSEVVAQEAEIHHDWKGMGCTLVLALLLNNRLHVVNVGDSRAYLIREKTASVLTRDHSAAAELLAEGKLSALEARNHPLRNHLTMVLGMVEGGVPQNITPAYRVVPVSPSDRIVLCSDGLWDMISDADIARIVSEKSTPSLAASALIDAANDAGGHDNITVIVIAPPCIVDDQAIEDALESIDTNAY